MVDTLPVGQLSDFLPTVNIKQRQKNHDQFIRYAKQRELLSNIDQKLDYHNMHAERHPYVNELKTYMAANRRTGSTHQIARPSEDPFANATVHSF